MAKQIAVIMCAINLDNQRKLFEGMIKAAKETDVNLYAFSNYISFRDKMENAQGAYQIMHLPDFREFDGVIFVPNTLQYPPAVDYVKQEIGDLKIPAVSIDKQVEGMGGIGIASYEAEFAMVEHFILEHGCKEIIYISGPTFNPEGQKRYQAYCDALEKHQLEYKPENVYEGVFTAESGQEIAQEILKREEFPRYIICGNDALAIGAMEMFKEHGYLAPDDIKIAGFDNGELSGFQNPPMTTVDKNQHEVGYEAVYEILKQLDGGETGWREVECKLEIRQSCGCTKEEAFDLPKLKDRYVNQQVVMQRIGDIIRNMTSEISGLETAAELIEAMKKYVRQMQFSSFYLCLCESKELFGAEEVDLSGTIDIMQLNADYTPNMRMALAYENEEFVEYPSFCKGKVLPDEIRKRSGGNFYVAVPIYYQRCCYGYCVAGNSHFPLEYSLYFSWVTNIGIGMENIRKWLLLKNTVVKLNGMWTRDTMTKLYNRAGFYHVAEAKFTEYQMRDAKVFLTFVDVDGLKPINDTLGHEMGDAVICEMAEIIKQVINEERFAMRYGGDEFVIFGLSKEEDDEMTIIRELRHRMEQRNARRVYPFDVKASIGNTVYRAKDMESLEEMIEIADKKMYEEKRKKREQRALEKAKQGKKDTMN